MIVHPDCEIYNFLEPTGYSWEDDLYLTGSCLPTSGRIATYSVLLGMFGTAACIGWHSIYSFWVKTRDFSFLKKVTAQTLLFFTLCGTVFTITYFFYLFHPHPVVSPILMSISSTLGQYGLYLSSESWFQSLEGTKGSAGSNIQDMTGKVLIELRKRSRIVIASTGIVSLVGYAVAGAGLTIFHHIPPAELDAAAQANAGSLGSVPQAVTAYAMTTAGMSIVHGWTAMSVLTLSFFVVKYGYMLADMILDTVEKMGGRSRATSNAGQPASGEQNGAKSSSAYDKMQAKAMELRRFAGKQTLGTAIIVASMNFALFLWGLGSLSSPQGPGYTFWLISFKSFMNGLGTLQAIMMFGPALLKKDKQKKPEAEGASRRPSEAPSVASRTDRQKTIAEANKRESMHEAAIAKTAEMREDSAKPSVKPTEDGAKLGVKAADNSEPGPSPSTAKTLSTTNEDANEIQVLAAPANAETLSPAAPNDAPEVVVTSPSAAEIGSGEPSASV
ncbi:hypothetical protein DFJ74DRAFT_767335 [Hyaloraphidium curvatum]|nr:hypothetical protein DFJ74DRAFT_767335 [Hyaloraphidium curvatum]